MILQLDPPLHLQTPKGPGWAHFVIDYGPEHDLLWTVFLDDGGASWTVSNPDIRMSPNWTMGRRSERVEVKVRPGSISEPRPECFFADKVASLP